MSDAQSVQQAVGMTVQQFGKLDIVFANAGINGVWAPIAELQPDEWDSTLCKRPRPIPIGAATNVPLGLRLHTSLL